MSDKHSKGYNDHKGNDEHSHGSVHNRDHHHHGGSGSSGGSGSPANLILMGGGGKDYLTGGNGDDELYGKAGNDTLYGGKGNDLIDGGSGNDKIKGGDGNDQILGGAGNDKIDGGKGVDVAVFSGNFNDYTLTPRGHGGGSGGGNGAITVHDNRLGFDGTDTVKNVEILRFTDGEYHDGQFYPEGVTLQPLFTDGNDVVDFNTLNPAGYDPDSFYRALGGNDTVVLPADQAAAASVGYELDVGGGLRLFEAGEGNDTVTGSSLEDRIDMGAGDDLVVASTGSDFLEGGDDNDTVSYALLGTRVIANLSDGSVSKGDPVAGTDTLSGFENVIGSADDDIITGDGNANVIQGGLGMDSLVGGAGADTFKFGAGELGTDNFDNIGDFNIDDGDALDIRDLVQGYTPGSESSYVNLIELILPPPPGPSGPPGPPGPPLGSLYLVSVDQDGAGTAHAFEQLATFSGPPGIDLTTLLDHVIFA